MKARPIVEKLFTLILTAVILLSSMAARPSLAQSPEPPPTETQLVAPANDNFADAQVFSGVSGNVPGTNVGATKEAGEQAHAFNRGGKSIWFKYVAPGNGVLTVDTFDSSIDTLLSVYVGNSVGNLTTIGAADNRAFSDISGIAGIVYLGTQTGVTYYIAVDGKNFGAGAASGNIVLHYQFGNSLTSDNFAQAIGLAFYPGSLDITTTNAGAGKEVNELNHGGNAGGRSVWFKWRSSASVPRTFAFTIDARRVSNPAVPLNALFAVYVGSSLATLTPVTSGQFTGQSRFLVTAQPGTTYYLAVDGFDGGQGAEVGNFAIKYGIARSDKVPDFDRDGRPDLTVYRPTTGIWYSIDSGAETLRSIQFGANGDKPILGDYDRDGKVDYSVYRPDLGVWYMNNTSSGFQALSWGVAADIPMARAVYSAGSTGYYQTVFRPTNGVWYTYQPSGAYSVQFGQLGDIPISSDFTGDGTDEYCVFRPSNNTWYILDTIGNVFNVVAFGQSGDKPVPADYDADGRTDIAVFRPSSGMWYMIFSSDNSFHAAQWGQNGDKPQPTDLDNDGKADLTVYRNGIWYIRNSTDGGTRTIPFGLSTDTPLSSPVP